MRIFVVKGQTPLDDLKALYFPNILEVSTKKLLDKQLEKLQSKSNNDLEKYQAN